MGMMSVARRLLLAALAAAAALPAGARDPAGGEAREQADGPASASAVAGGAVTQPAAEPAAATAAAALVPVAAFAAPTAATPGVPYDLADRILVRKAQRRLLLMRADQVVAEYPVRLGLKPDGHKEREGDFRTPEGVYFLSRRNPRSDFFLSIEVSYPNDADRRRAKRHGFMPGGSIMIHGQPNVPRKTAEYYASNDWTDGCIAVSNSDMVDIWLRTRVGLPIEIRP